MKKIFVETVYGIVVFIQFLVALCYFWYTISHFNFDNLAIFISSAFGLYFSIEYGKEFIDKWK